MDLSFRLGLLGTFALVVCASTVVTAQDELFEHSFEAAAFSPQEADAARFLMQTTFGITAESIEEVIASGYTDWVDAQIAIEPQLILPKAVEQLSLIHI